MLHVLSLPYAPLPLSLPQVGIFPCEFVQDIHDIQPTEIDFTELVLEEVIGAGGFGKVSAIRG